MRPIIEAVVDKGCFFEMAANVRPPIITGLARLDGPPVAVMASDPFFYGGAWTADACQKIIRFVDLAETFHLPIVYLCDCPGFMIGLEAEKAATIRHGVRAMAAVNQSHRAVVHGYRAQRRSASPARCNQPAGRFSIRYAWLSARWGSLPLEGGIEAAYRAEIDAAPDPAAKLAEIEDRLNSCARRSAPPRPSGSRRSSIPATPAAALRVRAARRAAAHPGAAVGHHDQAVIVIDAPARASWAVYVPSGEAASHPPPSCPRMRASSTPRLIGSITDVAGILDRLPSRTMTVERAAQSGVIAHMLLRSAAIYAREFPDIVARGIPGAGRGYREASALPQRRLGCRGARISTDKIINASFSF